MVSISIGESGFMWSAVAISITKDYVFIYIQFNQLQNDCHRSSNPFDKTTYSLCSCTKGFTNVFCRILCFFCTVHCYI